MLKEEGNSSRVTKEYLRQKYNLGDNVEVKVLARKQKETHRQKTKLKSLHKKILNTLKSSLADLSITSTWMVHRKLGPRRRVR